MIGLHQNFAIYAHYILRRKVSYLAVAPEMALTLIRPSFSMTVEKYILKKIFHAVYVL